jgi:glycosyltransferase involved in cell wall biosynthesis
LHTLWTVFFGAIALGWILEAADLARGVPQMASLDKVAPLRDALCPSVSILFAARDEAEKLPAALETFLALDYPRYEVIAVDDRSNDATGEILSSAARRNSLLRHLRLDCLPAGWLGKPHALQQAYEQSTGEWLVFTDADVHFSSDLLGRAVALAKQRQWDHLTLLGCAKMFTPGEKIAMTFFGMGFVIWVRPWRVSQLASTGYAGIGAFQLIRRSVYEAMGTHRRLTMEVVDDMKLGKLVKKAGFRSGVAKAGNAVSVHWHAGIVNMIRGTTKNFFATTGFRISLTLLQLFALLLMCILPVLALPFVNGWARAFDLVAIVLPLIAHAGVCREFKVSLLYALTYPIGAIIMGWMLAHSAIITLWQGGIVWRGTFYPLKELKRGLV